MSDEPAALALSLGRFRLVLGGDVGITAMEVVESGDMTRLDLNDLRGAVPRLEGLLSDSDDVEAIFVVAGEGSVAAEVLGEEVVVDFYGHGADAFEIQRSTSPVDPGVLKGVLVEAAFAAWRQRLADAADCLDELTGADAEVIGHLDLPGSPVLTELRAERRRNFRGGSAFRGRSDGGGTAVDRLVTELRAAVRFGAAGLLAASDDLLGDDVHSACVHGGWVDRLRLLIAAEEVCAIELCAAAGASLMNDPSSEPNPIAVEHLLAEYVSHREQSEDLAMLLGEVSERLPTIPSNPAKRLIRRKALHEIETVRQAVQAYSGVVTCVSSVRSGATTWDEAARALLELDLVAAADTNDGNDFGQRASQSATEAAAALGGLFAQQLPSAQTLVDDLARQHPGADAEGKVQTVKRQAIRKLSEASRRASDDSTIPEIVAELAMAIALLRGIAPQTETAFQELGLRILTRAERIANLHRQAGAAVPRAFAGFENFAKYVQPVVVEFVFNAMAGAKPGRPGAARDAYKAMRSKVWRARHNRGVAGAAAGGASAALMKAMDTAAPRLIVRYVDRSLPALKR